MHTVSLIGSGFNPDVPAPFDLTAHVDDLLAGIARGFTGGHADAETAWPADAVAFIEEALTDQAVSEADACHRNELHAAYARAKDLVGAAHVKIGREVLIDDATGPAATLSRWYCVIGHQSFGIGDSADEAVDAALANFDDSHRITASFGGFVVPDVARVSGGFDRSRDEALGLARRFALDVAHLDACTQFFVPGIVDLRPRRIAVAA
jgi:hypothetical protein